MMVLIRLALVSCLAATVAPAKICQMTPNSGGRQPKDAGPQRSPLVHFDSDSVPELCAPHGPVGHHQPMLEVSVTIRDQDCYDYYDVDVIVSQADSKGHESGNCSVVMMTDSHNGDDGVFKFDTVTPGYYEDSRFPGKPRPSVIEFNVLKLDTCHCFHPLVTQFYFKDDPHRPEDPCKDCGSDNPLLFFDCLPFSTSVEPGKAMKCNVNLTVQRNVSCGDDTPPQPAIRCRPECGAEGKCAASGLCVCEAGYTGALCEEKIVPNPPKCDAEPTPCAEMGPFYRPAQPRRAPMCVTDPNYNSSTVMKMKFTLKVQDLDTCAPLAHMPVDLWHANSLGQYMNDDCRSGEMTDADGMLTVETVYPMNYTGRPHHIHVYIHNTSQCHDRLVIQGYFKGDPLRSPQQEECKSCHSDDPRLTMECQTDGTLMTCSYTATMYRYRERHGCNDSANHHSDSGRLSRRRPQIIH